jgi:hypothetical protein
VAQLFEAYRRDGTSSLTLPQFRQVRFLHTARGEASPPPPSLTPCAPRCSSAQGRVM